MPIAEAGLLIHTFDNTEVTSSATQSATNGKSSVARPWEPCPPRGAWCSQYADRISASIFNKDLNILFGKQSGGIVISPYHVRTHCSYAHDGGTMQKFCSPQQRAEGCRPGCGDQSGQPNWCEPWSGPMMEGLPVYNCAWKEVHLEFMMQWHLRHAYSYNEVVIDTDTWVQNLPDLIEGIFFVAGLDETAPRRIFADFKKVYPQSKTMLLKMSSSVAFEGGDGDLFERVE